MGSENHPMGGWSRADHLSLTRDVDSQEHKGGLGRALFLLQFIQLVFNEVFVLVLC